MDIYNSTIAYFLNKQLNLQTPANFNCDRKIIGIDILKESSSSENILYLVTDITIHPKHNLLSTASFIFIEETKIPGYYMHSSFCQLYLSQTSEPISTIQLLQILWNIFSSISNWNEKLLSLQLQKAEIDAYFSLLPFVTKTPAILLSKNFEVLSKTENCNTYLRKYTDFQSVFSKKEVASDGMEEIAYSLLFRRDYQENLHRHGFYSAVYENDIPGATCYNFQRENEYIGIIVFLNMEFNHIPAGKMHLLSDFVNVLNDAVLARIQKTYSTKSNLRLHELFFKVIKPENAKQGKYLSIEMAQILKHYGWNEGDTFCVVNLRFFEGISAQNTSEYICGCLEEKYVHSVAIVSDTDIFWLLNCSLMKYTEKNNLFISMIQDIVDNYICKVGISSFFKSRQENHLTLHIREASAALNVGERKDPHLWYYFFQDYLEDYLLYRMTDELSEYQIYPEGIKKLLDYDQTNNTDFLRTLLTYYESGKNASKTADLLYLQRTSLNRKLKKIESIMGFDITKKDNLCIQIALELLKRSNY